MFSVVIYEMLVNEVEQVVRMQRARFEVNLQKNGCIYPDAYASRPIPPLPISQELVEEAKNRILYRLLIVNGGIFLLAGVSGYLLAGKTLQPIKNMVIEQNRFISDASHELRTPLTSLRTAFEVYLRDQKPTTTETRELVTESLLEVERLQKLSESLLELAQYQKTNGNIPFEKISVNEVIDEAIKKLQRIAKDKKISLTTDIPKAEVLAIKDRLRETFTILIENAIKYSSKKSTVSIVGQKTDKYIKISVIDTGIGIKKEDLSHIFDRFYRSDTARNHAKASGFGLGLSIAQKIVELHNGSIEVKSVFGSGTTFTVWLPLLKSR